MKKTQQFGDFDFNTHLPNNLSKLPAPQKRNYSNLINLSSNELHHKLIEVEFEKFLRSWDFSKISRYPYYPRTIQRIANFYSLPKEYLLLTSGSDDAIRMLMYTVAASGSKNILIQVPNYENYLLYARAAGVAVQEISYASKNQEQQLHELQDLVAQYPGSTAVLTNPNGFSGGYLKVKQVAELAQQCIDFNVLLIIDEAYASFANLNHTKILNQYKNILLVRSYSKSFGVAGLRIGALIGNQSLIEVLSHWRPVNSVSTLSMDFLVHCLEHDTLWQSILKDVCFWRTQLINNLRVNCPTWKVYNSKTNFVLINTGSSSNAKMVCDFLESHRIIVKRLSTIRGFENCFRVTVAPPYIHEKLICLLQKVSN